MIKISIGVNFYKDVELIKKSYDNLYIDDDYEIKYVDNHSTSWSGGNVIKLDELFKKYTDIESIPTLFFSYDIKEELVDPFDMYCYCKEILEHTEDENVMEFKERLEYIKDMSSKCYYISYDCLS